MTHRKKMKTIVSALLLLSSASERVTALAHEYDESWIGILKDRGYWIQEGVYGLFDVDTCFSADTCYAINPLTPYGLMYLPAHPNETILNYTNTCYKHNLCKRAADGTMLYPGWRLGRGETVVVVGKTPPKSTYWSISPSLYTRYHSNGWISNATGGKRIVACPRLLQLYVAKSAPSASCPFQIQS